MNSSKVAKEKERGGKNNKIAAVVAFTVFFALAVLKGAVQK
jgi:hypothetical protein